MKATLPVCGLNAALFHAFLTAVISVAGSPWRVDIRGVTQATASGQGLQLVAVRGDGSVVEHLSFMPAARVRFPDHAPGISEVEMFLTLSCFLAHPVLYDW